MIRALDRSFGLMSRMGALSRSTCCVAARLGIIGIGKTKSECRDSDSEEANSDPGNDPMFHRHSMISRPFTLRLVHIRRERNETRPLSDIFRCRNDHFTTATVFLAAAIGRGRGRIFRQFWLRVGHASEKLSILNLIFTRCGEAILGDRLCSDCRKMGFFGPALFFVGQTVLADTACR